MSKYTDELLDKIRQVTAHPIHGLGYELVDLTLSQSRKGIALRFLVDRPAGGISLQDCAMLNERLGEFLDEAGILEKSYVLEVSSPGADRPLAGEKDFLRACGRRVRVFLKEPIKEKIEIEGVVDGVQNNCLILKAGTAQCAVPAQIPLNQIKKAKQVIK